MRDNRQWRDNGSEVYNLKGLYLRNRLTTAGIMALYVMQSYILPWRPGYFKQLRTIRNSVQDATNSNSGILCVNMSNISFHDASLGDLAPFALVIAWNGHTTRSATGGTISVHHSSIQKIHSNDDEQGTNMLYLDEQRKLIVLAFHIIFCTIYSPAKHESLPSRMSCVYQAGDRGVSIAMHLQQEAILKKLAVRRPLPCSRSIMVTTPSSLSGTSSAWDEMTASLYRQYPQPTQAITDIGLLTHSFVEDQSV